MTINQANDYLKQAFIIDKKINLAVERISAMRSSLVSRGHTYDSPGGKPNDSSIERAVVKIIDYEQKINDEIDRLVTKKMEIESEIDRRVASNRHKELLIRRYVMLSPWEEIAEKMCYDKRYLFKMHKQALSLFAAADTYD